MKKKTKVQGNSSQQRLFLPSLQLYAFVFSVSAALISKGNDQLIYAVIPGVRF